jgi:hypothetical protein
MAIVDSYRYAASGLGVAPTLDDFKAALRRSPTFAALEVADESVFDDSAELYQRRYFEGATDGAIADEIRANKVAPLLRARKASAPDEILIAYARLMADQYEALGAHDAEACFNFATKTDDAETAMLLPQALRQRDAELTDRALRANTTRQPPSAEQLHDAALALSHALIERFGVDRVRLLTNPTSVTPAQHAIFCQLSAGMFRAIADDLTPPQAGAEMSSIFAAMAKAAR